MYEEERRMNVPNPNTNADFNISFHITKSTAKRKKKKIHEKNFNSKNFNEN